MGVQFQIIFLGFVQYSIKDIYLIIEKKNSCHFTQYIVAIFFYLFWGIMRIVILAKSANVELVLVIV